MSSSKIDPVRVVPDAVWDKVLSNLDPDTLLRTKSVSKSWQARASQNAEKRDDVPVHASSDELHSLHHMSIGALLVRFWHFAVVRQSTPLFDFAKTHPEEAKAKLLLCVRIYALLLLLVVPMLFVHGNWLFQTVEVMLLVIPGFLRLPHRVSQMAVFVTTIALIRTDSPLSLPLSAVASLALVVLVWSMFLQRFPAALFADSNNRLPLFFAPMTLPIRSLRFVGWICTAASSSASSSVFSFSSSSIHWIILGFVFVIAFVALPKRPLQMVQFGVISLLVCCSCLLLQWQALDAWSLAQSSLIIFVEIWFLSTMPIPWFQRSLFVYKRRLTWISILTLVVIVSKMILR